MPCSRSGTSPSTATKLRLFAESAGFCQNPSCLSPLFVDTDSGSTHIGEMAHIIAASGEGPRGNSEMEASARADATNFVLLCPTCHTLIDKEPNSYPETLIRQWKDGHRATAEQAFGAVAYSSREDLRAYVQPLLTENKAIFDRYGPDNDYRFDPESDLAFVWRRQVLARIVPNSRRILLSLDRNRQLLNSGEIQTLEAFRLHVGDIERRHLGEGDDLPAARFPSAMDMMAVGE